MRSHYTLEVSAKDEGKTVELGGFVREVRDVGSLKFLILAERGILTQVIIKKGVASEEIFDLVKNITRESVVTVKGKVKANKQAPRGFEIIPEKITLVSKAETPLPAEVTGKTPTMLDTRLDNRALDLRRSENAAIFVIQNKIVEAAERWLRQNGFMQVFTPCLMAEASESGSEVFKVIYYNGSATLRQDPQLHRQLSIAGGLDKVFDIGPSWRAEASHTTRHLTEHRTIAVELSFIKDEYDVMKAEEEMVAFIIKTIKEECAPQLEVLGKELKVPKTPFPVLTFPEVYDILEKEFGKKLKRGDDLDREAEKMLAEYIMKKHKSEFFFVNRFPYGIKPFYVMKYEGEPWARSVDMVFKGLEQSSGGQREHRHDVLVKQIKEKGLTLKTLKWFTDPFRFGVPTHGGFAIGLERFTMQLLDIQNVREAVLFPRGPERLTP